MTITKASAITLFSLCALLFSGCCDKQYIVKKCETPKPIKSDLPICGGLVKDMDFAECARIKFITLQSDYDKLESAFESCK